MFVIFGWLRRFTVLGMKLDECAACGQVCQHVVGRKTNWGHVFWIPVLFLGFSHGMICSVCGTWGPLPWRSVREAMKSGVLHLDRARPHAPALLAAAVADEGKPAPTVAAVFDRLLVNPKRGPWDLYLKAWPVLAAALLVLGAVTPKPATTAAGTGTTLSQPVYGTAHQCWEGSDGSVSGCRLANGSIEGFTTGTPITCYFYEPLSATTTSLSCRAN
jgi:hypothetical protein